MDAISANAIRQQNARLHRRGRVYCRLLQDSWPSEGQEIDGKSPPSAAELMSAMAGFFFLRPLISLLSCARYETKMMLMFDFVSVWWVYGYQCSTRISL